MYQLDDFDHEFENNYKNNLPSITADFIETLYNKKLLVEVLEFISSEDNVIHGLIDALREPTVANKLRLANMFVDFAMQYRAEEKWENYCLETSDSNYGTYLLNSY